MVSHCCWKNNEEIITFERDYKLGDKYFLVNIINGEKKLLNNCLDKFGDGHPSIYKNQVSKSLRYLN